MHTNEEILAICAALVDRAQLSNEERRLLDGVSPAGEAEMIEIVRLVREGHDPLGDAYVRANAAVVRRRSGSVYTPATLVSEMVAWCGAETMPDRVVDCGCGSGRFALACARAFPGARVVAVDNSPLATLMCRANAAAANLPVTVVLGDFVTIDIPFEDARSTLWIGNPPYVRHHELTKSQKQWYRTALDELDLRGSTLAGLHAHFVLSIARRIRENDTGCLLLSAEWMDTGYGASIRGALVRYLGLSFLRTFPKTSTQFEDTLSSAVIIGFAPLAGESVMVNGAVLRRGEFVESDKWSDVLGRRRRVILSDKYVHLGDIARVHRGVVTGKNGFWVRKPGEVSEQLCTPVVSHARELAGEVPACRDVSRLSRLVTLPDDLSVLPSGLRHEAEDIISEGLRTNVHEGFVARHRRNWWSVKPSRPPAIMMTYMARHAPNFVVNYDNLAMLNVVHGIYLTVELSERAVSRLAAYLNTHVSTADGRTYAGGLTKFEPREVERLVVPAPEVLEGL